MVGLRSRRHHRVCPWPSGWLASCAVHSLIPFALACDDAELTRPAQMPCASLADVFISVREDYNLPPSEVIEYLEQRRQERENKYWEVHGPPPMYGDGDEPPAYGTTEAAAPCATT